MALLTVPAVSIESFFREGVLNLNLPTHPRTHRCSDPYDCFVEDVFLLVHSVGSYTVRGFRVSG